MKSAAARNKEMGRKRIEKIGTFQVGIYLRLSVEDGDKKESESINSQRRMLENFVKQREDMVLIKEYIDDGHTGTNFERPGFQRMLADAEAGTINCVIVKDLSRFGRNHIDTEIYITRHFKQYGVRFIAISDNFDTLENGYDLMFSIRNIFNEHYSRDISRKINAAIKTRQKAGEFIGAFASYGYKKSTGDKHKLEIDPEAAEVVRRIYAMYLDGMGKHRIAAVLNTDGILCPSEYKTSKGLSYENPNRKRLGTVYWTYSTIDKILKNRMYTGDMTQGRRHCEMHGPVEYLDESEWVIVENTHPPIIDRETWESVQRLLLVRRSDMDLSKNENIFAGLMKCGDCGYAMVRKHVGGNGNYNYMDCGTYRRSGCACCSPHSIRIELLQKIILDDLNNIIRNIGNVKRLVDEAKDKESVMKSKIEIFQKEKESTLKALERVAKLLKRTFEMYAMDEITAEEYTLYRSQYLEQEQELKARLKEIEKKLQKKEEENGIDSPWIKHLLDHGEIKELTRAIIQETIKSIVVYGDKRIEITYLFSEEYDRLMQSVVA